MKIFFVVLLHYFLWTVKGAIMNFHLYRNDETISGYVVRLQCTVNGPENTFRIYKEQTFLCTCVTGNRCIRSGDNKYTYTLSNNEITVRIPDLEREMDQGQWRCVDSNNNQKVFDLQVYNVPNSLILVESSVMQCDLGMTPCTFTCKTGHCTYPAPTFTWHYSDENREPKMFPGNIGKTEITSPEGGCSSHGQKYEQALVFNRYTTFTNNVNTTLKLQCRIQVGNKNAVTRKSNFSQDVVFAVRVSDVSIYDEAKILTDVDTLVMNEYDTKQLTCKPGYGHPTPTVKWFIGIDYLSSSKVYTFKVNNSHHDKMLYCRADNIDDGKDDAVSGRPKLFVKVRIHYVYIEPALNRIISVIENQPEPVVCVTSPGRPRSKITWFKANANLPGDSNTVEVPAENSLTVTKSTRNITVDRPYTGWTVSCSASNSEKTTPIEANNSKSFEILYPPERMEISYSGARIYSTTIEVVRDANISLICSAVSNPKVAAYSWNTDGSIGSKKEGDTLLIDNIQSNKTVNCTAKNIMNTTSGNTETGFQTLTKYINVLYEATISRLVLYVNKTLKNADTVTVNENDELSILCEVDSNPGSDINLKRADKLLSDRQNSLTLAYNISSANCSHNGDYSCLAWNTVKINTPVARMKLRLNVICAPMLAEETDTTVFAIPKISTILSATVIAFPEPTYHNWFKNTSSGWQEVTDSSEIQITHTALQFNLTFRNVREEDYGEYNLTVGNGIGHPSSFLLFLQAHEEAELQSDAADNGSTAGIIGGVVGGLLVMGMIIVVLCILRRRRSFDGMKAFLFSTKSSASRRDMDQIGEDTQDAGYSYALVDKPKGQKEISLIHNSNVPAAATKQDEGPCYENPAMLDDSNIKDKPPKKAKTTKPSGKKQPAHNDGLVYIDIHFEDKKSEANQKRKQKAAAKPKVSEGVVYDAVQFGVVGESYHEEK